MGLCLSFVGLGRAQLLVAVLAPSFGFDSSTSMHYQRRFWLFNVEHRERK